MYTNIQAYAKARICLQHPLGAIPELTPGLYPAALWQRAGCAALPKGGPCPGSLPYHDNVLGKVSSAELQAMQQGTPVWPSFWKMLKKKTSQSSVIIGIGIFTGWKKKSEKMLKTIVLLM